ncbi:alcohol oxidase [Mollisia scopiformis]|uniref:Alcohol oxidase n=1 Tax=Mollisia scopiformis TaxID=149040 RepID=A0A132BF81_MOLSC|nr:alcohol oxidase [Mollisia scopiformis]KUJ10524.1 alcohol oxidase [Mollisia scopiformis]
MLCCDSTEVYDYIVVGSGPGGGPLASRLAIAGFKVLLIDAGNDQGTSYQEEVPTLWPLSTQYAPMQWNYFINHFPTIDRQEQDSKFTWQTPSGDYFSGPDPPVGSKPLGVLYPRAGTLGGCATHNAMVSLYAHDSDWDYIANLTGDSSWAPDNMRIYFEKLERNEYLPHHASGHGRNGWLGTSVLDESILVKDSKIMCHAAAAARVINNHTVGATPSTVKELQKIMLPDSNKPGQTDKQGFYELPLAVSDGKRSSPRDFVLSTANAVNADGSRKYHLDVRLNTFVTKINFDQGISPPRATGVEYLDGVGLYSTTPKSVAGTSTGSGCFEASREVIISAGSFNTPQLLKLSGVGSRAELESFGIPVVADLPGVGSNLQDRYETTVVTKTDSTFEILDGCSLLTEDPDLCLEKWENGTTPAQKGFYAGNAFPLAVIKKSSVAVLDPDVFLFGGPVFFRGFYPGWANVTELLPSTAKGWWTWFILKAHGRNHAGTVTLRSTNPLDTPIINFNSFDTGTTTDGADEKDLQAFYEGVQFARQVNNELNCDGCAFEEVFPGPNFTTEADAKNFIKHEAFGHHASCTAAIGSDDDPNAVLDSSFRVRNVTGLRVVDASSFPLTPGMFIAVPIYMISEKAADVIIKDASQ